MTLQELFAASWNGFPEVESIVPVQYATSNIGLVVELKVTDKYKGCGVVFPGINYISWYYAEDQNDKRKKCMKDLKIVNPYIKSLLDPAREEMEKKIIWGIVPESRSEGWFERMFMQKPVPKPVCTKPNCMCLEIEESKQGGPVKQYPCLADNCSDLERIKTRINTNKDGLR